MKITEDQSIIKQGYYYQVEVTWDTNPGKTFIHEYGNKIAAENAVKKWDKYRVGKATYKKVML